MRWNIWKASFGSNTEIKNTYAFDPEISDLKRYYTEIKANENVCTRILQGLCKEQATGNSRDAFIREASEQTTVLSFHSMEYNTAIEKNES